MNKRLDQMDVDEISALSKDRRDSLLYDSAVLAVRRSFDGNSNTALRLLELVSSVSKLASVTRPLTQFFEKWGQLRFDKARCIVRYSKNHNVREWTNEYEAQIKADRWIHADKKASQATNTVLDADQELRKVVSRLRRISQDPGRTILHSVLLSKVEEVFFAYGRTDEWVREDKKGSTLFDQSVRMTTTRATKFAKGS